MKLIPYKAAWVCDAGYSETGRPLGPGFTCKEVYESHGEFYIRQGLDFVPCPGQVTTYDPRGASLSAVQAYKDFGFANLPIYSPVELKELAKELV